MSITDDEGQTLLGPVHVSFDVAKRFDISVKRLRHINLVQRSLAESDARCDDGVTSNLTYPAWGGLEFVK